MRSLASGRYQSGHSHAMTTLRKIGLCVVFSWKQGRTSRLKTPKVWSLPCPPPTRATTKSHTGEGLATRPRGLSGSRADPPAPRRTHSAKPKIRTQKRLYTLALTSPSLPPCLPPVQLYLFLLAFSLSHYSSLSVSLCLYLFLISSLPVFLFLSFSLSLIVPCSLLGFREMSAHENCRCTKKQPS